MKIIFEVIIGCAVYDLLKWIIVSLVKTHLQRKEEKNLERIMQVQNLDNE